MKQALKPYMIHDGEPWECATLAFAANAREARNVGAYSAISDSGAEFIDIRANLIKEPTDEVWQSADLEKLANGTPHYVNSPIGCSRCTVWGVRLLDGLCETCHEARTMKSAAKKQLESEQQ